MESTTPPSPLPRPVHRAGLLEVRAYHDGNLLCTVAVSTAHEGACQVRQVMSGLTADLILTEGIEIPLDRLSAHLDMVTDQLVSIGFIGPIRVPFAHGEGSA